MVRGRSLLDWRANGKAVQIDPTAGRRWVDGHVSADDYFRAARRQARAEARADLAERLRQRG